MAEMSQTSQLNRHSTIRDLLIEEWKTDLVAQHDQNRPHPPNYFVSDPSQLVTRSFAHSFTLGTGDDIFTTIIPAIEAAESELLLVTCFWARSSSLDQLCSALRHLSEKALRRGGPRIRVSICFSSRSVWQKLFQTSSLNGHVYPPKSWAKTLRLPPCEQLGGLEMSVKSVFVRPFSVMHPKFVVVDRSTVFLPSCNVSWEDWFEGCVELSGPIVEQFVKFWEEFWDPGGKKSLATGGRGNERVHDVWPSAGSGIHSVAPVDERVCSPTHSVANGTVHGQPPARSPAFTTLSLDANSPLQTVFLPSPHHLNPRFRPFPWQTAAPAPPTPLNTFILHLISLARTSVYIQTPNLTSPPIFPALLDALQRGVDVHIVTNPRLMLLEQLGTAGTTTGRCVKKLIKRYKALSTMIATTDNTSLERGQPAPGRLRVEYFQPRISNARANKEPVQSHLKLTIVDSEATVLGSGNMDRASWYTSQELGVAFFSTEFARSVQEAVDEALMGRKVVVFEAG